MTATCQETRKGENVVTYYSKILAASHARIPDDGVGTFVPHPNTILISPDPPDTESKNGIIFPECAIQDKCFGTVLAVPEDCIYAPGDRVLFRTGGGTSIDFPGIGPCIIAQFTGDIDDEVLGKFAKKDKSS